MMPLFKPVIRQGTINFFAQSDVTCYILRGKDGDLLIDTGFLPVRRGLLRWVEEYDIRWVFLTHAHPDHDWNAAEIQQKGAKIILNECDRTLRRNFLMQRVMPTANRWRLRNVTQNIGGGLLKSPAYEPDIYFSSKNTDFLKNYGFDATVVPLPGHTYGSSGILHENVLYCGDAFTALNNTPQIPMHAVNPDMMAESLQKILDISPKWLACGHGLPVRFTDAKPVIQAYLWAHNK